LYYLWIGSINLAWILAVIGFIFKRWPLPDYGISIAAMINKYDHKCIRSIVKDLIEIVTGRLAQK
jgi:hypothetical protein